jgi:hypothetical protein
MASRPCSARFISLDRIMGVFDYGRAAYRRWVVLAQFHLVKRCLNRVKSCQQRPVGVRVNHRAI